MLTIHDSLRPVETARCSEVDIGQQAGPGARPIRVSRRARQAGDPPRQSCLDQQAARLGEGEARKLVLDIGCGVATTALRLAGECDARVIAADLSPLMLERARRAVRVAGVVDRVEVPEADILDQAGLTELRTDTGPFEMMTPRGFLKDEGWGALRIMGRALSQPAYLSKMAWLMPRMARAVPYLGYILVAGHIPGET